MNLPKAKLLMYYVNTPHAGSLNFTLSVSSKCFFVFCCVCTR